MFEAFRTVLLDFPKRTVGAIVRVTAGLGRLSLVIRKKRKKKTAKNSRQILVHTTRIIFGALRGRFVG